MEDLTPEAVDDMKPKQVKKMLQDLGLETKGNPKAQAKRLKAHAAGGAGVIETRNDEEILITPGMIDTMGQKALKERCQNFGLDSIGKDKVLPRSGRCCSYCPRVRSLEPALGVSALPALLSCGRSLGSRFPPISRCPLKLTGSLWLLQVLKERLKQYIKYQQGFPTNDAVYNAELEAMQNDDGTPNFMNEATIMLMEKNELEEILLACRLDAEGKTEVLKKRLLETVQQGFPDQEKLTAEQLIQRTGAVRYVQSYWRQYAQWKKDLVHPLPPPQRRAPHAARPPRRPRRLRVCHLRATRALCSTE